MGDLVDPLAPLADELERIELEVRSFVRTHRVLSIGAALLMGLVAARIARRRA